MSGAEVAVKELRRDVAILRRNLCETKRGIAVLRWMGEIKIALMLVAIAMHWTLLGILDAGRVGTP